MKIAMVVLMLLGAHLSLTALFPAAKAWWGWPFGVGDLPTVAGLAGLIPILSGVAGLAFLAAVLSLLGWWVPTGWLVQLVVVAAVSSILLFLLHFGLFAILPLGLDGLLLWLVLAQRVAARA